MKSNTKVTNKTSAKQPTGPGYQPAKHMRLGFSRSFFTALGALTVAVGTVWSPSVVLANNDPFRVGDDAREMTPEVAIAMNAYFCDGNYAILPQYLDAAEVSSPNEPMIYVSRAALAYLESDYDTIADSIDLTLNAVTAIEEEDPLRAHIYSGAAFGMRAAHRIVTEGLASGLPQALPDINLMFQEFRAARRIDPNDPELNFMSGFIDLMMTRHDKALEQFESIEHPIHMALHAQALAYRDMEDFPVALRRVDQALATGCESPDLFYLKAQILRRLDRFEDSVAWFDRALALSEQLPDSVIAQIEHERDRAEIKYRRALREERQAARAQEQ